jgi:hypothetical protein
MKPAAFELSRDVEKLVAFIGDRQSASYVEMSVHIGRTINGRDRYVLDSARRVLERQGKIFVAERGIGVRRATNGQIAVLSTSHPIDKTRRVTRRAKKRERHVNVQQLADDERRAFYLGRLVLEIIDRDTSRSFRNQIRVEIDKREGEVVSLNQLAVLPRHRQGS